MKLCETCLQLLSTFGFRSCVAWSFPSPFFCKADFVQGSDEAEARYIALTSTPEDAHELVATSMRCPHARFAVKACQTSRTLHEFCNILEQCGPILARRRLRSLQDGLHSRTITRHAPQASKESAAWPKIKKYCIISSNVFQ